MAANPKDSSFPSSGELAPNPVTGRTYFPSRGWSDEIITDLDKTTIVGKAKPATLTKQKRDPRFSPEYNPLEIMFLSGAYQGKILDVGFNIQEFSESQSAEWSDCEGTNIKVGSNFVKITPRTFSLKFEFSDIREDIRQLVEAIAHTQEIDGKSKTWTPPLLRIVVGGTTISPVVCTQFDITYDEPLPDKKGFRHGSVSMSLKEIAGQGTPAQFASPLVSQETYLQTYAKNTSEQDKSRMGQIQTTKALLAPCLGEEMSNQIAEIIDNKKSDDIETLLALSPEAFLSMVTAGLISPETLKDPRITEKLKRDLATNIAKSEPGVSPVFTREVAQAIMTGDPSSVPDFLKVPIRGESISQFEKMVADYNVILQAMIDQKLDNSDPIFGKPTDKGATGKATDTSANTMIDLFGCALKMRNLGSATLGNKSTNNESDTATIKAINRALSNQKLKDAEVAKMFGLAENTPETVIRQIRNSGPYQSKEDFLKKLAINRNGVTGYVLYQNFNNREAANLKAINELVTKQGVTEDEIKKAFGANDEQAKLIMNKGKPFKTKQEFLDKLAKAGNPPDLAPGYTLWENFWINTQGK